jgi:CBS domain containing-hemolysin-like protein
LLLSGGLHRDEVVDACGFAMPDGEYETLAGFLLDRFGRIPQVGAITEHDGWRFEVVEMARLRVAAIRVTAPAPRIDAQVALLDAERER